MILGPISSLKVKSTKGCLAPKVYCTWNLMQTHHETVLNHVMWLKFSHKWCGFIMVTWNQTQKINCPWSLVQTCTPGGFTTQFGSKKILKYKTPLDEPKFGTQDWTHAWSLKYEIRSVLNIIFSAIRYFKSLWVSFVMTLLMNKSISIVMGGWNLDEMHANYWNKVWYVHHPNNFAMKYSHIWSKIGWDFT